jgi:DUF971 family protein
MSPLSIDVEEGGGVLRVLWEDGTQQRLLASELWEQCPSAAAERRRMERPDAVAPARLTIATLAFVGRYGVNIAFSDGHDRGIYPWRYLQQLAPPRSVNDFIIS